VVSEYSVVRQEFCKTKAKESTVLGAVTRQSIVKTADREGLVYAELCDSAIEFQESNKCS
jgi:hypothetical protein